MVETCPSLHDLLGALEESNLVCLSLASNAIDSDGAAALADELARPECRISELNLSGNQLGKGGQGIRKLVETLRTNSSLVTLNMSRCFRQEDECAMEFLFHALKENKSMKQLALSDCYMGNDATDAFLRMVKGNATLEIIATENMMVVDVRDFIKIEQDLKEQLKRGSLRFKVGQHSDGFIPQLAHGEASTLMDLEEEVKANAAAASKTIQSLATVC